MFKKIHDDLLIGKCPYCSSDSYKYYADKWMFVCFECERNQSWSFVEDKIRREGKKVHVHRNHINFNSLLQYCVKISELPSDHIAVKYVKQRKIPEEHFDRLFYTDRMKDVASPTKHQLKNGSPKLILPFFDEKGDMFAIQSRSLDNEQPRYMTLIFDESQDKIYGKDRVDMSKDFYCCEGPIDSLFLKNCVAMAGSDGIKDKYKQKSIVILDNEPRNRQIVSKLKNYIEKGFRVVIWPSLVTDKDINDMILNKVDVSTIISNNVYQGLPALIQLNNWKRI